jgi:hypothetical protein
MVINKSTEKYAGEKKIALTNTVGKTRYPHVEEDN